MTGCSCPPLEWDPDTGAELAHDFVEVGPAGTVESWTWVPSPTEQHPLDHPFAFALHPARRRRHAAAARGRRRLDRRDERPACGSRPAGAATRIGHITDIEALRPRRGAGGRRRRRRPADEPVTMMDYNASITYTDPGPGQRRRGPSRPPTRAASSGCSARCAGASTPAAGATARSTRSSSTPSTRSTCPQTRHDHQLHDHHAGAVPGPDRDRAVRPGVRAARRHRRRPRLPAADRRRRTTDVRVGMRVAAVWASRGREGRRWRRRPTGSLLGWIPTGEPDVDDPDLVNRIF